MRPFRKIRLNAIIILIGVLLCIGLFTAKPALAADSIQFKSASELAGAIRNGEISSVELLNLYIERIKSYNKDINAVVAMDLEAARKRAAEADKALAEGQNWGPLHGLPMTVKDVFEVVGMPATSGDPTLKNYMPERNAIAVQRLIDNGAIIFGKTNAPLMAGDFQSYNEVYGTTNNPWDLSRTPGGSSGGSSAALAAGFTALELGSDLGGSIRLPAHYAGVFGHKPTFGVVPRYGHIPPPPGAVPEHIMPIIPLWVCGPLARSAEDLELAMEVLTTSSKSSDSEKKSELLPKRKQQWKDYRVAVWFADSYPASEVDAKVLAVLNKTVEKLRGAGLNMDEKARPGIDFKENRETFLGIYRNMLARKPPSEETLAGQQKLMEKWAAFFKDYDVLLAPVAMTAAFPHDHKMPKESRTLVINGQERPYYSNLTWTLPAIVAGLPATVVPVGLTDSGLPVGVQIIGARLEDRTTIDFAIGLSKVVGGFNPPPGY